METKDIIKKYWFIGLIALILIGFIAVFAANEIKKMPVYKNSKQVDGEYIVYSVNDKNKKADEVFDALDEVAGNEIIANELSKQVANVAYETTTEILDQAANMSSYILQSNEESQIVEYIAQFGYYNGKKDLKQYCVDTIKQDMLLKDYYLANYDKIVKPLIDSENPKLISHILVKVADVEAVTDENGNTTHVANPTKEEEDKLKAVQEALKTKTFVEVASEYSEDSSASQGGLLGVVTTSSASNYVVEFKDECINIKPGTVSEVITTEYGYHIIKADEVDFETLYADSTFSQLLTNADPNARTIATRDKAYELKFDIKNEDFKNYLDNLDKESEAN